MNNKINLYSLAPFLLFIPFYMISYFFSLYFKIGIHECVFFCICITVILALLFGYIGIQNEKIKTNIDKKELFKEKVNYIKTILLNSD